MIEVKCNDYDNSSKGFLQPIQDKAVRGYQSHGMPVAGAMDQYAYQAANLLAGNEGMLL